MIAEAGRSQEWEMIGSGAGGSGQDVGGASGKALSGISDLSVTETSAGSRVMEQMNSVNM